jgi:hypothetical protein
MGFAPFGCSDVPYSQTTHLKAMTSIGFLNAVTCLLGLLASAGCAESTDAATSVGLPLDMLSQKALGSPVGNGLWSPLPSPTA